MWRSALLLLVAAVSLHAQVLDARQFSNGTFDLAGNWRFHKGDDPRWADPNFDDLSWKLISTKKPWKEQGLGGYSGLFWMRLKVRMPEDARHWKLLLSGLTSYEVYINGQFVGRHGAMPPHAASYVPRPTAFELPDLKGAKTATIALRFWNSPFGARYYDGGLTRAGVGWSSAVRSLLPPGSPFNGTVTRSVIGSARAIDAELQAARTALAISVAPGLMFSGLSIIAGIGLLLLYRSQKGHLEYIWLALLFLDQLWLIPELLRLTDHIPDIVGFSIRNFVLLTNDVLLLQFIFSFARLRVPRWVRVYQISLLLLPPFLYIAQEYGWTRSQWANTIYAVWQLPFIAVLLALLSLRLRGNREAGLLFWPLVIAKADLTIEIIGGALFQFGLRKNAPVIPSLPIGPFSIPAAAISNFLFLLAIGVVLFKRFNEVAAERERSAAELEAGRNVQSLLVPKIAPNTPGFHIESAYVPAQEVGGDFFQVLPGEDGSTLIVVGDVSGKGLKAAMVVATIVGALRSTLFRKPADVLAHLNQLLNKQLDGGFVTCCAALLESDRVVIANAGHLPPYLNGEPMELEANLPLGVIANITYAEKEIIIVPGNTLTFLSDGVVEARAEKGELLGFDRTRDLVRSSAQQIAETARSFGQEDDITVVTIRRELVGAYVA